MSEKKSTAKRLPMLTAARMGFTKDRIQEMVLAEKTKAHRLYHIVGSASQAIVKESKTFADNESIEFRGSFLAIDATTGEQYKSGKAYIPTVVEAEFASLVQANGLVEVALTVIVEYSAKAPASYVYNVESYGKEDNSAFEGLLAKIPGLDKLISLESGDTKKLAAPEGEKGGKGGKKGGKK